MRAGPQYAYMTITLAVGHFGPLGCVGLCLGDIGCTATSRQRTAKRLYGRLIVVAGQRAPCMTRCRWRLGGRSPAFRGDLDSKAACPRALSRFGTNYSHLIYQHLNEPNA